MRLKSLALFGVSALAIFLTSGMHAAKADDPDLGINLSGIAYWTSELPFANLALHASRWRVQPNGAPFTWEAPLPQMTESNYPKIVPANSTVESFLLYTPNRGTISNELIVLYDGTGQINYDNGARLKQRGRGRDVIADAKPEAIVAKIVSTDETDPIRNIRLYEPGSEKDVKTFRPAFLERWANMSAIRFMDWMQTNDSKIASWNQRPRKESFNQTENGVSLEHMIELANELSSRPWFNIPHQADDEYVRNFARQVKRDLDPSLSVYVEYSNEVWNGIFEQAAYAARMGLDLGLSKNPFEAQLRYYSQRTSEIIRIWEDVFAEDRSRVIGVYATQGANPWTSSTVLDWKDAKKFADVLAIAPYFGNSLGDPTRQNEVATWSVDRVIEALRSEVESDNKKLIATQATIASERKLQLVAYEGGQHLVGYGGAENNEALSKLFFVANRDPRMKDIYLSHLNNWREAGGGLYVLFNSMTPPNKWGSWGLLETEDQDPATAPKWQAVLQFIRERKR
jgi:hypothetical protein